MDTEKSVTPLELVLDRLTGGSRKRLADLLRIAPSTISCWDSPHRRARGRAGTIPLQYWDAILTEAQRQGVAISAEDLAGHSSLASGNLTDR